MEWWKGFASVNGDVEIAQRYLLIHWCSPTPMGDSSSISDEFANTHLEVDHLQVGPGLNPCRLGHHSLLQQHRQELSISEERKGHRVHDR